MIKKDGEDGWRCFAKHGASCKNPKCQHIGIAKFMLGSDEIKNIEIKLRGTGKLM
jgi:hypothetical protein